MASTDADADERLNDLLRRSRLFADFVAGKRNCAASELAGKSNGNGKGRHKRRRMQEAEEDAILVKQEEEKEIAPIRLDVQPKNISYGTMRAYQLQALNWMIRLHDIKGNGILADEMGLGKTLESISLLAYLKQYRNITGPHLVIVPKSTSGNWMREFGRWCPDLSTMLFHGTKEERVSLKLKVGTTDVCVTTYDMCTREKACLSKINWYYIYIDEAHRIKNENSLLSQIVRTFPSKRRLLITGTPLQNNLHELWALLNFLLPDVFDSSVDFDAWFDVTKSQEAEEGKKAIIKRLHTILRPFLLRRLKKDVEKDLPPKVEMKVFTGLTVMQKAWYTKLLERDIDTLNSKSGPRMRLLNIVMQLRKVCNHPYLFDGAEDGPPFFEGEHIVNNCGKMMLLDKLLARLKKQGSRVLIFSQMTRMLDILEDYCRYRRFKYCRIDGQTKQTFRDEQMDVFNAPDSSKFIFLLSTRAGGLGINLQTADTVVLYDSDWNPQMDLQAMDRAHRIGQKKQVNVYRFVTDGTIEVKVVERAYKKLFLNAMVIREGRLQEKNKGVKTDELMNMVRFGAEEIFRSKEATVSDEDIEKILKKSRERSDKDKKDMESQYDENLRDFSLDVTTSEHNYQTFEGKDYTGTKQNTAGWFIAPPKRERKSNYNVNRYYKAKMAKGPKGPKEFKPSPRHDFQFFNAPRLAELERKIWDGKLKLRQQKTAERLAEKQRKRIERERKRREAAEAAAAAKAQAEKEKALEGDGDQEPESKPKPSDEKVNAMKVEVEGEGANKEIGEKGGDSIGNGESEKMEVDVAKEELMGEKVKVEEKGEKVEVEGKGEDEDEDDDEEQEPEEEDNSNGSESKKVSKIVDFLTEEEEMEKEELEEEGFGGWTRQHLKDFIRACERFGRKDIEAIKFAVDGQSPDEVERYYNVFWEDERYKELKDYERYIKQIEKGETRIQKLESKREAISQKIQRTKKPMSTLTFPYPSSQANKGFNSDEDRFMICTLDRIGYGEWEQLKYEIRSAWQFRFDWFIKSRTSQELSRRVEYLVKLVEKDNEEYEKQQAAKRKKSTKRGSKKSTSKRKKSQSNGSKAKKSRR